MKNIFIGFLFIFLDFNLTFGHSSIELVPDFVGYIMVANGAEAMSEESPQFQKAKSLAAFMVVYTGAVWFLNLFGALGSRALLSVILSIVSMIISLYIPYRIIKGIKDMEDDYDTSLNGETLKTAWTILAVFSILTLFFLLLPILAIPCVIVSIFAAICFLAAFRRSKNLYDELKG